MSNGLATLVKPQNEMAKAASARLDFIVKMLPAGINPESFCMACMIEVNKLKPCDVASVANTIYHCAIIGLLPGTAMGHAYFIPYRPKAGATPHCQLVIGYRGFIELGFASDFLRDVHTDVILRDEKWRHWKDESGPRVEHEIPIDRPEPDRSNIVGAYCLYHSRDGGKGLKVMNRKQLNAVDSESNVWQSDYAAMCMKSPARGASKEWRLNYRLARAVELDEQIERGEIQPPIDLGDGLQKPLSLAELPAE